MNRSTRRHQQRNIPMDPELIAAMKEQSEAFRAKFGRKAGPGDPVFFDPEADTPQPISLETMERSFDTICDTAAREGFDPAIVHAMRVTRRIVTTENAKYLSAADLREWDDAIRDYAKRRP